MGWLVTWPQQSQSETASVPIAAYLATGLKAHDPDIHVVCGGPHITAMPLEPIAGVDGMIVKEGEQSLTEYIDQVVLRGSEEPIEGNEGREGLAGFHPNEGNEGREGPDGHRKGEGDEGPGFRKEEGDEGQA